MALVKANLKAAIKQAFLDQTTKTDNPQAAIDDVAGKIADAIDAFVKSATVTVAAGIPVATAGSATNQTGATTSTGSATIN
ncbi:MAG: hypothetical protein LC096_05455 [Bacteroidia bacterium]|nr:hypothetical protein [Bacteroidia bacterium]